MLERGDKKLLGQLKDQAKQLVDQLFILENTGDWTSSLRLKQLATRESELKLPLTRTFHPFVFNISLLSEMDKRGLLESDRQEKRIGENSVIETLYKRTALGIQQIGEIEAELVELGKKLDPLLEREAVPRGGWFGLRLPRLW